MMRKGWIYLLAICLLGFASTAPAYTIEDVYYGGNDHGYGDRIGDSFYEVQGMDVSFSGSLMQVKVYTNFYEPNDLYGTLYGDLFISTDGWTADGSRPNYLSDNYKTGDWEYVLDTSSGQLFGGDFSIILSDYAPPYLGNENRYIVRNGQEVLYGSGGTLIDGNNGVTLKSSAADSFLLYNIDLAFLDLESNVIGLKWGMTCANDTIEGQVTAPVPEPGTLLLFGVGLIGLAFYRRRRN